MISIPSRAVDKDKLFAERVYSSHRKLECLTRAKVITLGSTLDCDSLILLEIADHIGRYVGHKMMEADDLQ
jgi:hypothetical protein